MKRYLECQIILKNTIIDLNFRPAPPIEATTYFSVCFGGGGGE